MSLDWLKLRRTQVKQAVINNNRPEDTHRAVLLMMYCAEMENGGVIKGCAGWNRTQWRANVACGEIKQGRDVAGLWHWQDTDLVVDWYDTDAERKAQGARERGRLAVEKRWDKQAKENQNTVSPSNVKYSKQNKTGIQNCNTVCNTEENRIEKKEINKEKRDKFISLEDALSELKECHDIVKGRLAE